MPKHVSAVSAVATALVAAVSVTAAYRALAADDCYARPMYQPSATGHWYYRLDAVNHRKCWYLVDTNPAEPAAAASPQPPPRDAAAPPSFASIFDSLRGGFASATPAVTQPATPNSEVSAVPPAQAEALPAKKRVQHPSHRPREELAADPSDAPLTEAQREALFRQFLQWRAQHIFE